MRTFDKAQKYAYLNELSTPELENILRADMALSGEGDIDMVLSIMEVIEQREDGKSPENVADTGRAKEEFYRIYHTPEGADKPLYATENQDKPILLDGAKNSKTITILADSAHTSTTFSRGFRHAWRVGLIAAITAGVMLGAMVVAQATGVDVFGAMARWTDEVFSLGAIRTEGAKDMPYDSDRLPMSDTKADTTNVSYTSIQNVLDAYDITEIAEPTWMPEGYVLSDIIVDCFSDETFRFLSAEYINGDALLIIEIERYEEEPSGQVEKTETPVEMFVVNDITVYILENISNNIAVWATEHYVYYIAGNLEKAELQQIAISAIKKAV